MNKTEPAYGPYAVGDKKYNLAPLTTRRYQAFIRVFTSLPLTTLYQAWSDFQASLQAKVPAEVRDKKPEDITSQDLIEVALTDEDMAPLGAAVAQMVTSADEQDVLVGLLAIALDIGQEEAAEIPYAVGLEAISDFFTDNPSLLPDSVRFLTGMVNPVRQNLQPQATLETGPQQKPNSMPASTTSQPKPGPLAGETKKVHTRGVSQ